MGEHVSKPREVNKSRKKGSERKIVTESEKELIKSTQFSIYFSPESSGGTVTEYGYGHTNVCGNNTLG